MRPLEATPRDVVVRGRRDAVLVLHRTSTAQSNRQLNDGQALLKGGSGRAMNGSCEDSAAKNKSGGLFTADFGLPTFLARPHGSAEFGSTNLQFAPMATFPQQPLSHT